MSSNKLLMLRVPPMLVDELGIDTNDPAATQGLPMALERLIFMAVEMRYNLDNEHILEDMASESIEDGSFTAGVMRVLVHEAPHVLREITINGITNPYVVGATQQTYTITKKEEYL